jgi:uncharacterized Fe-S cluster-containing protein
VRTSSAAIPALKPFYRPLTFQKGRGGRVGIDAPLNFDEMAECLTAGIDGVKQPDRTDESLTRLFPTSGGILKTMLERNPDYTYLAVDGAENCKKALCDIAAGNVHNCFIEMSACAGSCVGGPIMEKHRNTPLKNYQAVVNYAGTTDFPVTQPDSADVSLHHKGVVLEKRLPGQAQIEEILHKMGKFKPEDELNCGTCGYNTCREKASAIYQGKAEISMCLPYLMEQSERFSSNILITRQTASCRKRLLGIQQIKPAAIKMLASISGSDWGLWSGNGPGDFISVFENNAKIINKRDYYAECGKYLELTIVHDEILNNLIAILRDVTDEETTRQSKEQLSQQTIETADRVVDKQMRIVQEIASLLGETAAETKIALTKLKESLSDE